ncbi:MAG: putative transcriptional regulator of the TetR family [Solirubrobacterales bacterium]|nr:putative transcriptional regulator of the TetR family [Solirubrobacterales bacterium]
MMTMATHRTQEERRAETRGKLLDATIRSLLENGYAQTTTRTVSALAGVSPGAMAHYFPHRVDLLAAAIEQLVEQRIAAWREAAETLPAEPSKRVPALLDNVWRDFSGPTFPIFIKLWAAAADDAELYERLAESEERIARSITELAVGTFRELSGSGGWEGRLLVTLAAIRGLALTEHFEPRARSRPDPWPIARAALLAGLSA